MHGAGVFARRCRRGRNSRSWRPCGCVRWSCRAGGECAGSAGDAGGRLRFCRGAENNERIPGGPARRVRGLRGIRLRYRRRSRRRHRWRHGGLPGMGLHGMGLRGDGSRGTGMRSGRREEIFRGVRLKFLGAGGAAKEIRAPGVLDSRADSLRVHLHAANDVTLHHSHPGPAVYRNAAGADPSPPPRFFCKCSFWRTLSLTILDVFIPVKVADAFFASIDFRRFVSPAAAKGCATAAPHRECIVTHG